jgi:hypothetical protein
MHIGRGGKPHAGTAGAMSDLPGSLTVPSVAGFSAGTLRREAIIKLEVSCKKVKDNRCKARLQRRWVVELA